MIDTHPWWPSSSLKYSSIHRGAEPMRVFLDVFGFRRTVRKRHVTKQSATPRPYMRTHKMHNPAVHACARPLAMRFNILKYPRPLALSPIARTLLSTDWNNFNYGKRPTHKPTCTTCVRRALAERAARKCRSLLAIPVLPKMHTAGLVYTNQRLIDGPSPHLSPCR